MVKVCHKCSFWTGKLVLFALPENDFVIVSQSADYMTACPEEWSQLFSVASTRGLGLDDLKPKF